MTRTTEFRELIAFMRWADERMLDATAKLSPEQFTRDMGNSFPSIRDTLVHVTSADWVWLSRLHGESPTAMPEAWKAYDHAQLRTQWQRVLLGLEEFVADLRESDLDRVLDYRRVNGQPGSSTIGQILRHVVNHATYHRGQVTTMLRQLGASAPTTDLIEFYRLEGLRIAAAPNP
jgi:uncharacterized damage-inducible protein DinB